MPSFTDNKKRTWLIRITPWDMVRVKDFTGIDLGTILQDDMKLLVDLLNNEREFCVVLYYLCKPECDEMDITDEDFLTAAFGDCLEDASRAFQEALVQCFPTRQAVGLIAALEIQKHDPGESQRRIDNFLTQLTASKSRSKWRRLLAWMRGSTRATS